jgi:hypothetical protein
MPTKHTETNMNYLIAPAGNFRITSANQGGRRGAPAMPGRTTGKRGKGIPVQMSHAGKPGRDMAHTGTYGWALSRATLGIPAAGPVPRGR